MKGRGKGESDTVQEGKQERERITSEVRNEKPEGEAVEQETGRGGRGGRGGMSLDKGVTQTAEETVQATRRGNGKDDKQGNKDEEKPDQW